MSAPCASRRRATSSASRRDRAVGANDTGPRPGLHRPAAGPGFLCLGAGLSSFQERGGARRLAARRRGGGTRGGPGVLCGRGPETPLAVGRAPQQHLERPGPAEELEHTRAGHGRAPH